MCRKMMGCLLAAAFLLWLPGVAAARTVGQEYTIVVQVDCLDDAMEIMRALPGWDLHLNISARDAHFTRRVYAWAFPHTQEVLRTLGEVRSEREHIRHLGAELMHIDTRLRVINEEMERLIILLAASSSIDVLNAVDMQLTRVGWERDMLMGRRNTLTHETETVLMHISLTELYVPAEVAAAGFGTRLADSFLASWGATRRIAGNIMVGLVRASLPLLIGLLLLGGAGFMIIKRVKKTQEGVVVDVQE